MTTPSYDLKPQRTTMINDEEKKFLLPPLFNAAVRAGAAIMHIYRNPD